MNNIEYSLLINNDPNHLHGTSKGFHNQVWNVKLVNDTFIVLSHLSKDGEMGASGNDADLFLQSENEQLQNGLEYDHNFAYNKAKISSV